MNHPINRGKFQSANLEIHKKYSTIRIILVILLVTNLISFMVWQNIKGLDLDKQLSQQEKDQLKLHHIYNDKLLKYEIIRNSEEIKRFAKEKMNMVSTNTSDFISLGIKSQKKLIENFLGNVQERKN